MVGVWLYALRAWKDDESPDLAGTMSALDKALDQAEKLAKSLPGNRIASVDDPPPTPSDRPGVEFPIVDPLPPPPPEPPPSPEAAAF